LGSFTCSYNYDGSFVLIAENYAFEYIYTVVEDEIRSTDCTVSVNKCECVCPNDSLAKKVISSATCPGVGTDDIPLCFEESDFEFSIFESVPKCDGSALTLAPMVVVDLLPSPTKVPGIEGPTMAPTTAMNASTVPTSIPLLCFHYRTCFIVLHQNRPCFDGWRLLCKCDLILSIERRFLFRGEQSQSPPCCNKRCKSRTCRCRARR